MNKVLFSQGCDDWSTPKWLLDQLHNEFNFNYDPCPIKSKESNLEKDWGKRNFINPPYNRYKIGSWLKKGVIEFKKGKLCVFLLASRTDTAWWHDYVEKYATEVRFIKGRLKFSGHKHNAPFPSVIIIFDGRNKQ